MIITVGNTKGGVGKSTTALQLALDLASGYTLGEVARVWLIDGDRQQTSLTAVTQRGEAGKPVIPAAAYADGATLRAQVMQQRGGFDHIVIDVGGRDSSALRAALTVSDVVLIPFLPRSFDLWALDDMASLLEETRAVHDIRALAFLNSADPQGTDNAEAAEAVKGVKGIELLPVSLNRRKAFAHASGAGLHVDEYKPRDGRACKEISDLLRATFDVMPISL